MFQEITISGIGCSPFPFKGKARMGMGTLVATYPIPTPTLPLKGREIAQMEALITQEHPFDNAGI